jgi:outer membrane protein assembly factor BamE (lipoprotein component of BamABCDE complex)
MSPSVIKVMKIASAICLIGAVVFGILLLSGFPEGYCYLYPQIGTVFATGYTDKNFSKIRAGTSTDEVRRLLGEPLFRFTNNTGSYWYYSFDKKDKVPCCDFAWLARTVIVSNSTVIGVERCVYND